MFDTSAYSAFMRGHLEITQAVQEADAICLNPIVLGELQAGFMRGSRTAKNKRERDAFLASPRVAILPIDEATSVRYAVILDSLRRAGTPIPTNDIWIAATAMQHGLQVLTTDRHYLKVAQVVVHHVEAV
jgi:tRNA(fMet)-specific endonuclease VapC